MVSLQTRWTQTNSRSILACKMTTWQPNKALTTKNFTMVQSLRRTEILVVSVLSLTSKGFRIKRSISKNHCSLKKILSSPPAWTRMTSNKCRGLTGQAASLTLLTRRSNSLLSSWLLRSVVAPQQSALQPSLRFSLRILLSLTRRSTWRSSCQPRSATRDQTTSSIRTRLMQLPPNQQSHRQIPPLQTSRRQLSTSSNRQFKWAKLSEWQIPPDKKSLLTRGLSENVIKVQWRHNRWCALKQLLQPDLKRLNHHNRDKQVHRRHVVLSSRLLNRQILIRLNSLSSQWGRVESLKQGLLRTQTPA